MMIDSVVWAQYINVTDTQTVTQTAAQPRHHSNSRPGALDSSHVRKRKNTVALTQNFKQNIATCKLPITKSLQNLHKYCK